MHHQCHMAEPSELSGSRSGFLQRSKSGRKHAVGDDGETAPVAQEMARPDGGKPEDGQPSWVLQPLTLDNVELLVNVHNEGFGSKRFCCCFPVAEEPGGEISQFYAKHPERLPFTGLAVSDGVPLGFVMLAAYPMNDRHGLHTNKPGEAYVEMIGVAAAARGKGIGKALLGWAEAKAREGGCTELSLSVLNGNPAIRLYERYGFKAMGRGDPVDKCCDGCAVVFLMGRPYGFCDRHFGSTEMRKPLTEAAEPFL